MDTKTWRFIAAINMIGMFLIVLIFVLGMKDGNSCLTNPLVYGAEKLTTYGPLGTEGVQCQCSFKNPAYDPFSFNQENVSVQSKITGAIHPDVLAGLNLNITSTDPQ